MSLNQLNQTKRKLQQISNIKQTKTIQFPFCVVMPKNQKSFKQDFMSKTVLPTNSFLTRYFWKRGLFIVSLLSSNEYSIVDLWSQLIKLEKKFKVLFFFSSVNKWYSSLKIQRTLTRSMPNIPLYMNSFISKFLVLYRLFFLRRLNLIFKSRKSD